MKQSAAMTSPDPESIAAVDAAIISRRSVRAFLADAGAAATIEDILSVASRAPSGTNTQPWKVHVLTRRAATPAVRAHPRRLQRPAGAGTAHREEYDYYPTEWVSPYIDRRRKIGWDLYGLLGIANDRQGARCTRSTAATTPSSARRSD